MSWLRRAIDSDSTWFKLHKQEVFPNAFDPHKYNFETLSKAKLSCRNPFWKDVYSSILECRLNVLIDFPDEYKFIPINGEPHITSNRIPIRQEWAANTCLNTIIDREGNLKDVNEFNNSKKPFDYEYKELKVVLKDFLDTYLGSRLGVDRREVATNEVENGHNIYGRIVTKRKKGSSFFYSLLNTHARRDGWAQCSIKLESDSLDLGLTWNCSEHDVVTRVRQVNKTQYFNRLKQFYLRLMRNNLYLGKTSNTNNMCFICNNHPEKSFPVMFSCKPVKVLLAKVIQILKNAGLLRLGDNIEMFLFSEYSFDTLEN